MRSHIKAPTRHRSRSSFYHSKLPLETRIRVILSSAGFFSFSSNPVVVELVGDGRERRWREEAGGAGGGVEGGGGRRLRERVAAAHQGLLPRPGKPAMLAFSSRSKALLFGWLVG